MVTRRTLLAAVAGAVVAARVRPAGSATAPRIAAIDWAMAETAMALGRPPQATAELMGFRRVAPLALPDSMIDLGLRGSPNLEALSLSAPDLILSSNYYSFAEPQLARIAPVLSRELYVAGQDPLPKLLALVTDLAVALGDPALAGSVLAGVEAELDALADRLTGQGCPCILLEIGAARHVRVFGKDSLFGGTLHRLGLANAWTDGTRFAFNAPVPMERLADFPEAALVIVGDVPPQAARSLQTGAIWNRLAPVRRGNVFHLPEINAFGGVPSAVRFARELTSALASAA